MKLFYIGFMDWYRDNPNLMFISTATVSERAKTYKVDNWITHYPTFELNNETFFNPNKLEILNETKKTYQSVFKKNDLEDVVELENGYLGRDIVKVLKYIKGQFDNKVVLSETDRYILKQIDDVRKMVDDKREPLFKDC